MASIITKIMNYGAGIKVLRSAFRDYIHDLERLSTQRVSGWWCGVTWITGLMFSAIYMIVATPPLTTDKACQSDSTFQLHTKTYSIWSSSGFFKITYGGGHLSFAQAKVVDIVWDVGIGRGGQFVLAFISWRVFAKYLTLCMEAEPITYRLFRTVFLEKGASLLSTYQVIRSFLGQRRLRSKTAMAFMVVTMIFILAFPTLITAMSGYDSNVESYVPDFDNRLIQFNRFSRVLYIIHDGRRINLTDDYLIIDVVPVTSDVKSYGLGGIRNDSTHFHDWTTDLYIALEAPALNISAFVSGDKFRGGHSSSQSLGMIWLRGNETFDYDHIESNGTCQSTDLFVCIMLLHAWTIGIYTMWLQTHYTMALRNRHADKISGEHLAVIELAAAMKKELNIEDTDAALLREKQLEQRVDKELRGGTISYAYTETELKTYSIKQGYYLTLGYVVATRY
ncbi:hypothetical protein P153DRAFT_358024 [Dothidotthia symphoricarpi CBS 119687]|uniref:Uncharacterized protein n=1 Tax=Dothidotthia symphoricarpi CBS 119687 TaxID=1392245 RepID=A0A6A6AAF9_9PLEO|nr:uncharacterized protein P153DRAFT_358024 [Dothidotthia symphoricarpi CBS 119687]KAF2127858.1 hypothetical protein P153DRAFT_358024 [Dothidotthia symphoricarpi CBS 119687]